MNNIVEKPLVTVAVPSFNQGNYLDQALSSIFDQQLAVEVFVLEWRFQRQHARCD